MRYDEITRTGCRFGFIPHRLSVPEHPEFNAFPFNILFAKYKTEDGKTIMGSALYEPDLTSYRREGEKCTMEYHNVHGGRNWVVIEYDESNRSYFGQKFVNDKPAVMATGLNWNMFFAHLTMLGLKNGERCLFDDIDSIPSPGVGA